MFVKGEETNDDEFSLHMPSHRKVAKEEFNKLGFGAGGLCPLMYSHILYNWGTMTFFKSEQELQNSMGADDKPILPEITYTDLPVIPPDDLPSDAKGQSSYNNVIGGRSKRKFAALDGDSVTVSAAKRVKKAASQVLHRKKANLNNKGYYNTGRFILAYICILCTIFVEKGNRHIKPELLVWSKKEDRVVSEKFSSNIIDNVYM